MLAAPATQLPFTPRNAAQWPNFGGNETLVAERSAAEDGGRGLPSAQRALLGSVFAAVLLVAIVGTWVILRGQSRHGRSAAAEAHAYAPARRARATGEPRPAPAPQPQDDLSTLERTPQQRAAAEFLAENYRVEFMREIPVRAAVWPPPLLHQQTSTEVHDAVVAVSHQTTGTEVST